MPGLLFLDPVFVREGVVRAVAGRQGKTFVVVSLGARRGRGDTESRGNATTENGRSRGRAELVCIGLREGDSFTYQSIDVWRFVVEFVRFAIGQVRGVGADVHDSEVVGEDEDDVRRIRGE